MHCVAATYLDQLLDTADSAFLRRCLALEAPNRTEILSPIAERSVVFVFLVSAGFELHTVYSVGLLQNIAYSESGTGYSMKSLAF